MTLNDCINNAQQICDCDANDDSIIIMLKTRLEKELSPSLLDFIEKYPDEEFNKHIKQIQNAIEIYNNRLNKKRCNECQFFISIPPVHCSLNVAIENRNRATINRPIIFQPVNLEYCKKQREKESTKLFNHRDTEII